MVGQDQVTAEAYREQIRERSASWNSAFSQRDTTALKSLFAKDIQMASAGRKCQGISQCARLFPALFKRRPDITWRNEPIEIEVNVPWATASEMGTWKESWTEPDGRATIDGKYFILWKRNDEKWFIHAVVYAPTKCTGESTYCQ